MQMKRLLATRLRRIRDTRGKTHFRSDQINTRKDGLLADGVHKETSSEVQLCGIWSGFTGICPGEFQTFRPNAHEFFL